MGGRWHVDRVDSPEPDSQPLEFTRLASGFGSTVTLVDDDLAVEDPDGLRTHKQLVLRPGGLVQRVYLRHVIPEDRHGWSGEGTVVQTGSEMQLCLGDDDHPRKSGQFECSKAAERIVLRRIEAAPDCRTQLQAVARAATWQSCTGPLWRVEHCRLGLLRGTWRIISSRADRETSYFDRDIGKTVTIENDQLMFDEYHGDFVTHKQITFLAGGSVQRFELRHDLRTSKGWSAGGVMSLRGDELKLCFMDDDFPTWGGPRFECLGRDDLVLLQRAHLDK